MNDLQIERLPPVMGVKRAAELAGVHAQTIRRWIAEGRVTASRPTRAGSARIVIRTDSLLTALGLDASTPTTR